MMKKNTTILYCGDTNVVPMQSGIYPPRPLTRIVEWGVWDGKRCDIRITFREGQTDIGMLTAENDVLTNQSLQDPIVGYRTAMLLSACAELSDCSIQKAMQAIAGCIAQDLYPPHKKDESLENLIRDITTRVPTIEFSGIRQAVPKNLEEIIASMQRIGIRPQLETLQRMVSAQKLRPTQFLKGLGVDYPEVLKARQVRLTKEAEKYSAVFREYIKQYHLEMIARIEQVPDLPMDKLLVCPALWEPELMAVAIQCLERGVTEAHDIFAFSICTCVRKAMQGFETFFRCTEQDAPEERVSLSDPEQIFARVCPWVAGKTGQKTQDVLKDLRVLWAHWDSMPIIAE